MINFRDDLTCARFGKKNPLSHPLKAGRDLKYRKVISVKHSEKKDDLGSIHHTL